jgi:hypothetical protein
MQIKDKTFLSSVANFFSLGLKNKCFRVLASQTVALLTTRFLTTERFLLFRFFFCYNFLTLCCRRPKGGRTLTKEGLSHIEGLGSNSDIALWIRDIGIPGRSCRYNQIAI